MLTIKVNPFLVQILHFSNSCSRLPADSLLGECFTVVYIGLKFSRSSCGQEQSQGILTALCHTELET